MLLLVLPQGKDGASAPPTLLQAANGKQHRVVPAANHSGGSQCLAPVHKCKSLVEIITIWEQLCKSFVLKDRQSTADQPASVTLSVQRNER